MAARAGQRVLELGCGCGLVGLAAAAAGASEVVMTDLVLAMARRNLEHNFPEGSDDPVVRAQPGAGRTCSALPCAVLVVRLARWA